MHILLIMTTLPWPLEKSGAAQRSGLLLQALQNWGDVDVLVAAEKSYLEQPKVREHLQESPNHCIRKLELDLVDESGPWRQLARLAPGKIGNLLRDLGRSKANFAPDKANNEWLSRIIKNEAYDMVVVRYLQWAMKTGAAHLPMTDVLLDYDDVDWQVYRTRENQAERRTIAKRIRGRFVGWYVERIARKHLRNFAHVWVTSEEDRQDVRIQRCSVLPNVPRLSPEKERRPAHDMGKRNNILLVATLVYKPNADGLTHFLSEIWPTIRKAHPGLRLKVVGQLPQEIDLVNAWKQSLGVDLSGFVENLDESYEQALFTIAPVYWGGGTKIKVLESLGRRRTCVATCHALHGLGEHIRHEDSLLSAETDENFIQACLTLIEEPETRQRLERRGEEAVRSHFSVYDFNKAVDSVMQRFVGHLRPTSEDQTAP